MKETTTLGRDWAAHRLDDGWEYTQAFETEGEFGPTGACVEFRDLTPGATVLINGTELGASSGLPFVRFEASGAIHAGRNEIAIRIAREAAPAEICREARVVTYDKVSISGIDIDPEVVDNIANIWITVFVGNHTNEEQLALASIVLAQGENTEKVEISEMVQPSGGEIDAVVRIMDPSMWQPDEAGEQPLFDCLIGLQIEGEIMDVAEVQFQVSP